MSRTYRNVPRKAYKYPSGLIQFKSLNIEALDRIKGSAYSLSKNNRVTTKANSRWAWDDFPVSSWDEISVDINPYDLLDEEDWFIIPYIMNFPNVIYKCRNYLISKRNSKKVDIKDVISVIYMEDYKIIGLEDSFLIFDSNKKLIAKDSKELGPYTFFEDGNPD